MSSAPKVLCISKRTSELCATQSLVYGAGCALVAATSLTAARSIVDAVEISAVILCRHSWTDQEREEFVSDLAARHPGLRVVLQCPGCSGCDEAGHRPGTLCNPAPVTQLIAAITEAKGSRS